MQQQQEDFMTKYKKNFNFTYTVCLIHQRCLVVPIRKGWGVRALGTPCALALVLMVVWSGLSHDPLILAWAGLWLVFQVARRAEAVRLAREGAKVHSEYDGIPFDAMRYCRSEKTAKLVVEPVLVAVLGGIAYWVYQQIHWSPFGLPYFLLAGVFTLPFVETVKQKIWERRTQAMADARVEQEAMVNEFRNRYGDS